MSVRFLPAFAILAFAPFATPAAAQTPVPTLAWAACPAAAKDAPSTAAFQCAEAQVPIDYADPSKGDFTLAVIRHPATDPAAKVGTLFWNPGGPSDAGTAYLPAAIDGFPEKVRQRFDIVSWDPRGMGGGTRPVIQCFATAEEEAKFAAATFPAAALAVSDDELATMVKARVALNEACVRHAGDLLRHVSTADVARDLDLLRQAAGETEMNYYGTSYGTFLGATYLNMFPEKVRAMVLDGAVAPSAWAGGPQREDLGLSTFIRIGSDFGARDTIAGFLDACGAVDAKACAFSAGSPKATRDKWDGLLARAKQGISVGGDSIDDRGIVAYVASSLYTIEPLPGFGRFPGFPAVGGFLQEVFEAGEGKAPADSGGGSGSGGSAGGGEGGAPAAAASGVYTTSMGRQIAVICGESPNPETEAATAAQAKASAARAGLSPWTFAAFCMGWTARADAPYLGPWDKRAERPVLVIGNTFDPATPFGSSVRMAQELGDARLLTVYGYGHTVLINPSRCAQNYVADYLIDGILPPTGATCTQDREPFPGD